MLNHRTIWVKRFEVLIHTFVFTARRFDFFDVGMMDILQYRLEKAESVMQGKNIEVTFKGKIVGKRRAVGGEDEFQVTWSPAKMWVFLNDFLKNSGFYLLKNISESMTNGWSVHEMPTSHHSSLPRISPLKKWRHHNAIHCKSM